jgi:phosphoribosylaminoimidazolecarboxamide formyltransferase/IMP cyclohydrolase
MSEKRAIISVSDKTGVEKFAKSLVELGFEIVSTGGTYKAIEAAGVPVTYISDVTCFPEILDGRVKTLHPAIHGGILAMRTEDHLTQLDELGIVPIDLVVVNLYPFRQTIAKPDVTMEDAIENIDIGGPTMVRAAAKNHKYVAIVVNPARYDEVIEKIKNDQMDYQYRLELATEAFTHTAEYDSYISAYLKNVTNKNEKFPATKIVLGEKIQDLRYGENPHQKAAFYKDFACEEACVGNAKQLHGKELSFNNIIDINAALELVREFDKPAATIIKHTNPCGTALGNNLKEAYERALEADPVSAFGGIVGLNKEVDKETAEEMAKIFLEAVIAPKFSEAALEILTKKKNIRLLEVGDLTASKGNIDVKKVNGGILLQETDIAQVKAEDLKVVTKKAPTAEEIEELLFAMQVVKHVKSNAIVVSKNQQIVGVGAGQMNRVGSAGIAFKQAGEKCKGAVLASDAFFPFRDTIDECAKHGITAVIQPGGSIRDEESIQAADEAGIAMVFTGIRHFKH